MRVSYHPEAEAELIEAAHFYEERTENLGAEFLDAMDRAIHVIKSAPVRWNIVEADVRRYPTPRFPYALYFRVLQNEIRILVAFKHNSRHPDYWRHRLPD